MAVEDDVAVVYEDVAVSDDAVAAFADTVVERAAGWDVVDAGDAVVEADARAQKCLQMRMYALAGPCCLQLVGTEMVEVTMQRLLVVRCDDVASKLVEVRYQFSQSGFVEPVKPLVEAMT
jgi:hypothetical protein